MHLQRNQTIGSSRIINSEPTSDIYPWMVIVATLFSIDKTDKTKPLEQFTMECAGSIIYYSR